MTVGLPESFAEPPSPAGVARRLLYADGALFASVELSDGAAVPAHSHTWGSLLYFTAGCGRILLGRDWSPVAEGSVAIVPADTTHGLRADPTLAYLEVQWNCPASFAASVLAGEAPRGDDAAG